MKKIDVFVFSGTGNTMKCAKELERHLMDLGATVNVMRVENGTERVESVGDTVVVCYPVHGFNAPINMIRFCEALPAANADFYVLKTSGEPLSINDNSSGRIERSIRAKGYAYRGEYHFVMPYNMIFRHTDEMAAKMWATAKARIPTAAQTIFDGASHVKRVSLKAKVVSGVVSIEHWGARFNGRFFRVKKDKCIGCMQCVKNCPTHNISYENGRFKFGNQCLLCTRCSFNCPTDAFRIGLMDFMRVNGRYNFKADPEAAEIGRYCRRAYTSYFQE